MTQHQQLSVVIAGAGIAGLTAAIALRRAGHKVTIYEKSSLSHEIGQGITIAPNGGRILQRLGLDFEKARFAEFRGTYVFKATTLERLAPLMDGRPWVEKFGMGMYTAYRISLHAALVDLAQAGDEKVEGPPVEIVTMSGVEAFEEDAVVLTSGQRVAADLIVAADGVQSSAASFINGPECPPLDSSGTIVYRFTLSEEKILSDPLAKPLLDEGFGYCSFYVAPQADRWLLRYWCRDDGLQNFAFYVLRTYEDAEKQEHALRFRSDRESLLRDMEGFHPAISRVAEMATDVLPLWRCTTREPLQSLTRGNVVVIGDAAHPVKPHHGLGAISAMEDAGVLGTLMQDLPENVDSTREVRRRLELFNRLRRPRVAVYKYYSDVPFFGDPVTEQRKYCERFMKSKELPTSKDDIRLWYMRHDAVDEAKEAVQNL